MPLLTLMYFVSCKKVETYPHLTVWIRSPTFESAILVWRLVIFARLSVWQEYSWDKDESGEILEMIQGKHEAHYPLDAYYQQYLTYRTANLQIYIFYIYSSSIGTDYFKHGVYCPFLSLQNAVCFIILTCLVPVLFKLTFRRLLSTIFDIPHR